MTFLIVLAVLYFGMRFLFRTVLPAYVAKNLKEMQEKMQDAQARQQEPTPEGEVKIVNNQHQENQVSSQSDSDSDYIEFEEIDSEE